MSRGGHAGSGGQPEAGATPAAAARSMRLPIRQGPVQEQFNLVWLDQDPMNDSQALAVTKFSDENNVTTISQLVALSSQST